MTLLRMISCEKSATFRDHAAIARIRPGFRFGFAFGQRFGIAAADLAIVQRWLQSKGFRVERIPSARRAIIFTGTIGQLNGVEIETLRIQDCAVADPDHPNWRRDPAIAGGGVLMDHGWHAIYLASHWFGEKPIEVRASFH